MALIWVGALQNSGTEFLVPAAWSAHWKARGGRFVRNYLEPLEGLTQIVALSEADKYRPKVKPEPEAPKPTVKAKGSKRGVRKGTRRAKARG